jgi:hypothetical protein
MFNSIIKSCVNLIRDHSLLSIGTNDEKMIRRNDEKAFDRCAIFLYSL